MSKKNTVVDDTVNTGNVVEYVENAIMEGKPAADIRSVLSGLYRETAVETYATERAKTTYIAMMLSCTALERMEAMTKPRSRPTLKAAARKKLRDQLTPRRNCRKR